jgi:hypothetical protein
LSLLETAVPLPDINLYNEGFTNHTPLWGTLDLRSSLHWELSEPDLHTFRACQSFFDAYFRLEPNIPTRRDPIVPRMDQE